jgi:hypothetical protein
MAKWPNEERQIRLRLKCQRKIALCFNNTVKPVQAVTCILSLVVVFWKQFGAFFIYNDTKGSGVSTEIEI